MLQRWITRLGPAYIVWMMVATRLCGLVGGVLVVYYVGLTLELSGPLQFHWKVAATAVVLNAVTVTVLLALWETRKLRAVMRLLHLGHPFPAELGREAGREAVVFPIRHHMREAFLVPLCCLPPVYVYLTWAADASATVLIHISIATFIGVAGAVSMAYFVIERLMLPVVRHLMDYGVVVDYENLPTGRLYKQLLFSFALTVLITALMITTLAMEKANRLVNSPDELDQVVRSLRVETIAISGCAFLMALVLSSLLAKSVSIPVQDMVRSMRRVEAGSLTERITAISTNEIGILGRSFNRMVERLEENQAVIQELNANLERKVRERTEELRLAQGQLVHSEKMTSLGELVAGIAHEINNAVNAVYNGIIPLRERIEKLRQDVRPVLRQATTRPGASGDRVGAQEEFSDPFALVQDLAEVVESGAKRAAVIVSDLRKFAHPGEDRRSLFDVHEGLKIAVNLLHNKMKNRVKIEQEFCADGQILCSGAQLAQVFLNVLDNSQQALSDKGTIHISTQRKANHIVVRVRDNGVGIPEDIVGRIFDPFFTTKKVGVGTGLGLSISYGIVKGHGGTIDVSSPPPGHARGTEFTITLPVEADEAPGSDSSTELLAGVSDVSSASERGQAMFTAASAPGLPEGRAI